jgi:hypothetical protein
VGSVASIRRYRSVFRDPTVIPEERLAYQEHARTSLRKALHFLRHELGSDVVVRRGDEEVGINREPCRCEVVEGCSRTAATGVEDADAWR